MNSVRSLMGDVSFHGMATPPRCAMLREAVTHVAGLRCYPCRRPVPAPASHPRLQQPASVLPLDDGPPVHGRPRDSGWPKRYRPSELGPFFKVRGQPFVGHPLLGRPVQLGTLARQSASLEPVELVADGLLDRAAPIRELALGDEAGATLQALRLDGVGDLRGGPGDCSLV